MAFVRAAKASDIPVGTIQEVQVDGKAIAIANVEGKFYAIDNTCLHRSGPLGQGDLQGKIVTCPWHGWQYDVTTGQVVHNPSAAVARYAAELRGDEVFVHLAARPS
jgi:nitrite reductase/ring-hydroxylating ferredoxin subunit